MKAGGSGLVRTLARLEAHIDFPEEDLPSDLLQEVQRLAGGLAAGDRRPSGRQPARRAAAGRASRWPSSARPNSGKSSLLNYLAGRDAAIVSARAGTTRDVVEVRLDLGGYPSISRIRPACGTPPTRSRPKASSGRFSGRRMPTSISCFSMAPDSLKSMPEPRDCWMNGHCLVVSRMDLAAQPWNGKIEGATADFGHQWSGPDRICWRHFRNASNRLPARARHRR